MHRRPRGRKSGLRAALTPTGLVSANDKGARADRLRTADRHGGLSGRRYFRRKDRRQRIRRAAYLPHGVVRGMVGSDRSFRAAGRGRPDRTGEAGGGRVASFPRADLVRSPADFRHLAERIRSSARKDGNGMLPAGNRRGSPAVAVLAAARAVRDRMLSGHTGAGGLSEPTDGRRFPGAAAGRRIDEPHPVMRRVPSLPDLFRRGHAGQHPVGQPGPLRHSGHICGLSAARRLDDRHAVLETVGLPPTAAPSAAEAGGLPVAFRFGMLRRIGRSAGDAGPGDSRRAGPAADAVRRPGGSGPVIRPRPYGQNLREAHLRKIYGRAGARGLDILPRTVAARADDPNQAGYGAEASRLGGDGRADRLLRPGAELPARRSGPARSGPRRP